MSSHRGVLHHMIVVVSDLRRSKPFYSAMFQYLGYELAGEDSWYQDWRRWVLDAPHEISICQFRNQDGNVPYVRGAVGHHHHMAFCALDREDVERFYRDILTPLDEKGLCVVEDPPCDCPEYGEGYYATFFFGPDGLKYEYVFIDKPSEEKGKGITQIVESKRPQPEIDKWVRIADCYIIRLSGFRT